MFLDGGCGRGGEVEYVCSLCMDLERLRILGVSINVRSRIVEPLSLRLQWGFRA